MRERSWIERPRSFPLNVFGRDTLAATLEPGWDYPDWEALQAEAPTGRDDDRDWNKVGGSPRYLQGGPPPGDWRLLFQFSARLVGHEMGDAAECYGLIDPDRRGLFLVESH